MSGRVEFVELKEHIHSFVLPDHYEFKPNGRFQFLQRWAWQFLRRRRALANSHGQTVQYTRHVIDTKDMMARLIEQRHALFSMHRTPRELLIGAEDFAELMCSTPIRDGITFQAEYTRDRQLLGLDVRVIPWMRGMVVLP